MGAVVRRLIRGLSVRASRCQRCMEMRRKWVRRALAIAAGLFVLVLGCLGITAYYHLAWAGATEQVTFKSGDLSVAGLLVKPGGDGPYPAVVILHGSGLADGTHGLPDYRIHANAFVRNGLAVLAYDKRGTGNSEGDFSTAIYDDFVQDAVSAIRFLRTRKDIDPLRIGLLGTSEGGWLTPEVATQAGDIAFIVNKCGPPISVNETVLFEIDNELQAAGLDPKVRQDVLQLWRRMRKYYVDAADNATATVGEREAINAALTVINQKIDPNDSGLPESLPEFDSEVYTRTAAKVSYDPTPFLRELDVPMLYIFGEDDVNVPTARSVAVLEQLKSEFNRDLTIKVYPDVGHSLMTWKGIASGGFVGDYLELIGTWAQEHAGPP